MIKHSKLKIIDNFFGSFFLLIFKPLAIWYTKINQNKINIIKENPKKIIFLKLLGGGTLVSSSLVIFELKRKFPNTKFSLIGSKNTINYAKSLNLFSEYIEISFDSLKKLLVSSIKCLFLVNKSDVIIDMEIHSKFTCLFLFLTFSFIRIGFYTKTNKFSRYYLSHIIYYNEKVPLPIYFEGILKVFSISINEKTPIDFYNHFVKSNKIFKKKKNDNIYSIGIAPFSSDLSKEREFTISQWKLLLKKYIKKETSEIIIYGGNEDIQKSMHYQNELKKLFPNINIKNKSGKLQLINSVKNIYKKNNIFITIDSGLNHLVRILDIKVYSYWGPTNPSINLSPYFSKYEKVIYSRLSCSPCVHSLEAPPCQGDNICMQKNLKNIGKNKIYHWIINEEN